MNSGVLAHAISIQLLLSVSSDLINATIEKNGDFKYFWDKNIQTKGRLYYKNRRQAHNQVTKKPMDNGAKG